ncbi:MAG: lysophospholipid acyltransferase family protein [Bellilinea sp.]
MTRSKINLQTLANSSFGTKAALAIGRGLPFWLGRPLARLAAEIIARQKNSGMVRALRTNLWVANDYKLTGQELDQLVLQTWRKHTRSLWDFYHHLNRPKKVLQLVDFSPDFQTLFDLAKTDQQPRLFVTVHTSNFELAGRALALRGLEFQILSYPQPPGGYQIQNKIRQESGIEMTPMSIESFQKARERLRNGGTVLTGVDRPLAQSRHMVQFFGRPSPLPVAYVQLALQTGAPILVVACVSLPDGRYQLICSPPIDVRPNSDRDTELVGNAEVVLKHAEDIIRPRTSDWCMFYPIWPELVKDVPA